jgi:hypothetical protein
MFLCWPIAKPISLILDAVLGHGKTVRHGVAVVCWLWWQRVNPVQVAP